MLKGVSSKRNFRDSLLPKISLGNINLLVKKALSLLKLDFVLRIRVRAVSLFNRVLRRVTG